jgi:hypothetical protein
MATASSAAPPVKTLTPLAAWTISLAGGAAAAVVALLSIPVCTWLVDALTGLSLTVDAAQGSGTEFLWRRLNEPPEWFGAAVEISPLIWLPIGWVLLAAAFAVVIALYLREMSSVGWRWAAVLACVRAGVLLLVFLVWLLPATRAVEWTEQQSRVLLAFDVSASMQTSDEPPAEVVGQVRPSRQEVLWERLSASLRDTAAQTRLASTNPSGSSPRAGGVSEASLLGLLAQNNPLYCYRFGEQLDPTPWIVSRQPPDSADPAAPEPRELLGPTAAQWLRWLQPRQRPPLGVALPEELRAILDSHARRLSGIETAEAEGADASADYAALVKSLDKALADQTRLQTLLLNRTNLGASLLELVRKEAGNLVQGLVVFSDGRGTAGSEQELLEAVKEARRLRIPVFTVGVGEYRQYSNLRLVDLLAPGRVQPEDEFPVRVAVEGENLPQDHEAKVVLKIEKPDQSVEELEQTVRLPAGGGRLAHATAEFRVGNPGQLKGEWRLSARVEAIRGERSRADNASDEPRIVRVEDRKLAVLLIASAPSREYQFLRTLLVREADKFDLSIWLQSQSAGTVQDVDPKKLLDEFPTDLRDRDDDPKNLGRYDVIVAIDPDWRQVPGPSRETEGKATPQENLKRWVEDYAGGLIVVAGPVHTFNLARERGLELIRELYPVVLDESSSSFLVLDRPSKEPWALNWGPSAGQMPFLDLTDAGDRSRILQGWEEFFDVPRDPETNLADTPAKRGFYSFFPLRDAKPAATVIARFSDPDRRYLTPQSLSRQPFFVLHNVGKGPVFYIGSGETYRLRQYSEKFHERFWTKLIRFMGKGDQARGSRRGLLVVGSRYLEGDSVEVEAQLFDAEMKPLKVAEASAVRLRVIPPENLPEVPPEWLEGLPMQPDASRPGWFVARFAVRRSGRYGVEVKIPGSVEVLTGKFRVEAVDPERDDTRPNFLLLHRIASEAREVQLLDERKRPALLQALAASKQRMLEQARLMGLGPRDLTPEHQTDRLFFDLDQARWIAECLPGQTVPFRTEGKVTDLWDKGITLFADLQHPDDASGPPWVLVVAVVLLGTEWLTRKLLKLA